MRSAIVSALVLLLAACAAAPAQPPVPPVPAVPAQPELPRIFGFAVDGPDLGMDWPATLGGFQGAAPSVQTLSEIETAIAAVYEWAEWREVLVIARPEPDADGTLHLNVYADAPAAKTAPPLALNWSAPDPVPPPSGAGGARAETALDAALTAWSLSGNRVLIDGGERRLYLKRQDGSVVSFPVAVGTARTPTPAGDYTVEAVSNKPTWYPPDSIRREAEAKGKPLPRAVPPGEHNPLGEWFVRLQNGIGIHGTNQPRSIGRAASHGCVRMHDRDVKELVAQLRAGDGVTVVRARAALTASKEPAQVTKNEVLQ